MVSGGAGLFQESLGGFRKGYVFHERLGGGFRKGVVVSGKSGVAPGKAAWFPGGLCSCRKDWVLVSGEAVRFQERLGGFKERLGGFRRCRVVSGKTVWFPARLCGFTKEDGLGLL